MILLWPPSHTTLALNEFMQRNGYIHCVEIEPSAGCRRFMLT